MTHSTASPGADITSTLGAASAAIVIGVALGWLYLEQSSRTQQLTLPPIPHLSAPADGNTTDDVAQWLEFGQQAWAAGRVVEPTADNALYYLQRALAIDPGNADAHTRIEQIAAWLQDNAERAIFDGDWPRARADAERLATLPGGVNASRSLLTRIDRLQGLETLAARAREQQASGRLVLPYRDSAVTTWQQMLELDPGNATARAGIQAAVQQLLNQAQSAAIAGDGEAATRLINEVRYIDPEAEGLQAAEQQVEQWSRMIATRRTDKQLEAASEALRAGRLAPPTPDNALTLYRRILEQDPESAAARRGLRHLADALLVRAGEQLASTELEAAAQTLEQAEAAGATAGQLQPLLQDLAWHQRYARALRGEFDRVVSVGELDVRRRELPDYPRAADGDGWVVVEFTVTTSGTVTDAEAVESSDPVFHDAALRAIRNWRFEPVLFADRPVPVRAGIRFRFTR